jgi:hypothetical protein
MGNWSSYAQTNNQHYWESVGECGENGGVMMPVPDPPSPAKVPRERICGNYWVRLCGSISIAEA